MKKKRNAFTLIEMVIVLAIVALLILLISPNLVAQKQRAEKKTDQALVTTLQTQVELAADEQGHQIKSLDELTDKYISKDQLKHAKEKGITIDSGTVKQK
ncbi:competence protein ComGC [Latilactobacillus sakei]|uniref:Uncharacterized protein n=1 Tax=Latilactobacillus sakei TaxID=1599 RepID=A0A9N7P7J9_LATSK|nr:prepilin-type N-terminal cleavage/methylation domain-containing protein [Latilactobacillus sakei]AWZ41804.1 competence protein ComGC [Latilactobacillus sakei]AWZ44514.1 competence protein ComGC [Latilactobacillus sakei]AWZ47028.1 competence protein ComGC [Latilactobacillus sakei]AYG16991.1 prepilin-type N-terminal cleavage/methylation domain-containing protein [Latilactobacillus sakei]AYG25712.1 prepilin-type N-terminal cleavage/methylation domain-containing protein [Latilactobacillus sakei